MGALKNEMKNSIKEIKKMTNKIWKKSIDPIKNAAPKHQASEGKSSRLET